jgi:hypothetical protein
MSVVEKFGGKDKKVSGRGFPVAGVGGRISGFGFKISNWGVSWLPVAGRPVSGKELGFEVFVFVNLGALAC